MNIRNLLFVSFSLLVCRAISTAAVNDPPLPMSSSDLGPAIRASNTVMVGKLVNLGWIDFSGPAVMQYHEALFEVGDQLKGTVPERIVCPLIIRAYPHPESEKTPEVGVEYIVAGSFNDGDFRLQKLLRATKANKAAVLKITEESPSHVPDGKLKQQELGPSVNLGNAGQPKPTIAVDVKPAQNATVKSGQEISKSNSRMRSSYWISAGFLVLAGYLVYVGLRKMRKR